MINNTFFKNSAIIFAGAIFFANNISYNNNIGTILEKNIFLKNFAKNYGNDYATYPARIVLSSIIKNYNY